MHDNCRPATTFFLVCMSTRLVPLITRWNTFCQAHCCHCFAQECLSRYTATARAQLKRPNILLQLFWRWLIHFLKAIIFEDESLFLKTMMTYLCGTFPPVSSFVFALQKSFILLRTATGVDSFVPIILSVIRVRLCPVRRWHVSWLFCLELMGRGYTGIIKLWNKLISYGSTWENPRDIGNSWSC